LHKRHHDCVSYGVVARAMFFIRAGRWQMTEGVKCRFLAVFCLVPLLSPVVPFWGVAEAAPGPALTIDLDLSSQAVMVSSLAPGIADFTGTLRLDPAPPNPAPINLSASVDKGWQACCTPAAMTVATAAAQAFSVTVTVPAGTFSDTIGMLNVTAEGRSNGTEVRASVKALITVMPYFGVKLICSRNSQQVKPGTTVSFSVGVRNDGSGPDSFELAIANQSGTSGNHLKATLSATSLTNVPADESRNVTVLVECPAGGVLEGERNTTFVLVATSINSRDSGSQVLAQCPLHVQVLPGEQKRGFLPGAFLPGLVLAASIAIAARALKMKTR